MMFRLNLLIALVSAMASTTAAFGPSLGEFLRTRVEVVNLLPPFGRRAISAHRLDR